MATNILTLGQDWPFALVVCVELPGLMVLHPREADRGEAAPGYQIRTVDPRFCRDAGDWRIQGEALQWLCLVQRDLPVS